MKLPDTLIQHAKSMADREALRAFLQEHGLVASEQELSELCWELGVPHGKFCPCCSPMLFRMQRALAAGQKPPRR